MNFDEKHILRKVEKLLELYANGALGGDVMPEDANPHLDKSSAENYAYFTLPMALNYQRNSYILWQSALQSWQDPLTQALFSPSAVKNTNQPDLQQMLTKHKLALQPNKQPQIWQTLCTTFADLFSGDVRNLFEHCGYSVHYTKQFMAANKKRFPYLGGAKISNYWLYVMQSYTDLSFKDRENISVAPDTHITQASVKLGLVSADEAKSPNAQAIVAQRWEVLLKGSPLQPIDVHTPLWLWSRGKFSQDIQL